MAKVTIYTTGLCGFCHAAKRLLKNKGVDFEEIDVTFNPGMRREMAAKAGRTSVPQIWIGETHVGGYDELYALDDAGQLDPLLKAAS
jgi:glutaredoxin 3